MGRTAEGMRELQSWSSTCCVDAIKYLNHTGALYAEVKEVMESLGLRDLPELARSVGGVKAQCEMCLGTMMCWRVLDDSMHLCTGCGMRYDDAYDVWVAEKQVRGLCLPPKTAEEEASWGAFEEALAALMRRVRKKRRCV